MRHVLRAHANKVQEARGDREKAKVIIRESIDVEDKWSCRLCEFPGAGSSSEIAMLTHARDKHGRIIKARPPPQQQQHQERTASQNSTRQQQNMQRAQPQQSPQVPQMQQDELACFLCPDNGGNRKRYPDSRLKAHLFAMHGCKVNQSNIYCNRCSFAAHSAQLLGLHMQRSHNLPTGNQNKVAQSQVKKPLNPDFIKKLSAAGIAVSKRGVEVTVVDDKSPVKRSAVTQGDQGPSSAKYMRRPEPPTTAANPGNKSLDLFIVGEVNNSNKNNNNSGPMVRATNAGSAAQSPMGQTRAKGAVPPSKEETGGNGGETAQQKAIQDLRARLASKLRLNAQLQKMAPNKNIDSTKARVLRECQMMKSELQGMLAAANRKISPKPEAAPAAPPSMKCIHCPFVTPSKNVLLAHVSKNHTQPKAMPVPRAQPRQAPQVTRDNSRQQPHTESKVIPVPRAQPRQAPQATRENSRQQPRTGSSRNRYQRAGIKAPSAAPKEDQVEVVPKAGGNAFTFEIKEQDFAAPATAVQTPKSAMDITGSALPPDLQKAIALAGAAVGSADPGGEVVLQEIVGPAMELDLDIVCENVPNNDAAHAPWLC